MPNTYVALKTETVAVATNSVTFNLSGISGYTDLVLVVNGYTSIDVQTYIQVNGDTGSNYSVTTILGDGSSATSSRESNQQAIAAGGYGTSASGNKIVQIQNYSNTTTNKTLLIRANAAGSFVQARVGLWRSTSAITSITHYVTSGNFAVGSTFSLYGIANADQGAAKATGGIITEDSQYWYHTFAASGTFTPKVNLVCDYLVVAGGGAGGAADAGGTNYSGGGGAGGLRSTLIATGGGGAIESPISVTSATPYAITVGAGGTASAASWTNGNNSIFSTITSIGGGSGGGLNSSPAWVVPGDGGSGGGGSEANVAGGARTVGQGFAGGTSPGGPSGNAGGGGGGAGAVGGNGSTNTGGVGGVGVSIPAFATVTTTGVNGFYAGGGGGSGSSSSGAGGSGGGGAGSNSTSTAGTSNTGGGGGSGSRSGAAGGSGIVIVRYAK